MNENEKAPASLNPEDHPITGTKQQEQYIQIFNGGTIKVNLPLSPPSININTEPSTLPEQHLYPNYITNQSTTQAESEPFNLSIAVDADGFTEADREFRAGVAAAANCPPRYDEYDPDVVTYYGWESDSIIAEDEIDAGYELDKPDIDSGDFGISEENGYYELKGKQISNCLIKVVCIYEPSNFVALSFVKAGGFSIERRVAPNDLNSNTKLNAAIKDPRFTFNATDKEIRVLKDYIFSGQLKIVHELERIGFSRINGAVCFADADLIIGVNNNKVTNAVLSKGHEGIKSNILSYDPITPAEMSHIQPALLGFNTIMNILPILGTCCSFFLKERFRVLNVKVPILNLYGMSGAGKSTTLDFVINPLFCFLDDHKAADIREVSIFSMIKDVSSSNAIPFIGDEYKPSQISKQKLDDIFGMLRNAYDGHVAKRGNPDKTVTEYPLLAPVVIAGEEGFKENALIQRSIIVQLTKQDRTSATDYSMGLLKANATLLHKLSRSLLNETMGISDAELSDLFNKALPYYKASISTDRIAINMAVCSVGLLLLNKVFEKLGLYPISRALGIAPEAVFHQLLTLAHTEMATKGGTSISAIDKTLEIIDVMIGEGELAEDADYKIVDGDSERLLALRIPSLYPKFIKFIGPRYRNPEIITEGDQFVKQIKGTPYLAINNHPVRIGGETMKCCCLSCAELLKSPLDIPNLEGRF